MLARLRLPPFGSYRMRLDVGTPRVELPLELFDGRIVMMCFVLDEARMRMELAAGETVEGCGLVYRLDDVRFV